MKANCMARQQGVKFRPFQPTQMSIQPAIRWIRVRGAMQTWSARTGEPLAHFRIGTGERRGFGVHCGFVRRSSHHVVN